MKEHGRILTVVQTPDLEELGGLQNCAIEWRVEVLLAANERADNTAVAFHRKCPIRSNRTAELDTVGDVKKGAGRERAS